jgi:hypothetical protein
LLIVNLNIFFAFGKFQVKSAIKSGSLTPPPRQWSKTLTMVRLFGFEHIAFGKFLIAAMR